MSDELLVQALDYAARGWRVLPLHAPRRDGACSCGKGEGCPSPAKHPRTANGLLNASTDPEQIRKWWKKWPSANIGIVTGTDSGFVVVDVDPDHGGETSLEELEAEHGKLPAAARVLTGGDGVHILFAHPGEEIRNNAGTKLGAGLDIRGDGGYIVAAPSKHISGNRYEWLALPDVAVELPTMPEWLLERLRAPKPVARPPAPRVERREGSSKYGIEALGRECADVARAAEGTRNNTLNTAAYNIGQLVAGGELEENVALDALHQAGLSCGLGAAEVDQTLQSGFYTGMRYPRSAPAPRVPSSTSTRPSSSGNGHHDPEEPPPPPPADEDAPEDDDSGPGNLSDTDLGNARRLVSAHGKDIRYVPQWDVWLIWDGTRWQRDATGEIVRYAKRVAEGILVDAVTEPDEQTRKKRIKFAYLSQARARLDAMVALARTEPDVPVEPHELDADPWLLNCTNGTINLRSGHLQRHDRTQLITKVVPIAYSPDAKNDVWAAFLETATGGDLALEAFLQRAVGYSLTGDCGEEVLFFVHGPAAAGKSTFIDALEATLGEYARRADFETFLARTVTSAGNARGDIARLAGARFVTSVEVDEGAKLAEGLAKTLTGGDLITARFLYKDEFEFRPQFKLWLAANHAPRVNHGDEAMWRRILRIPFEHVIPKEDRDPAVKNTLRDPTAGGPAILAWAIEGCRLWQQWGLAIPPAVSRATDTYRADQDPIADFVEDCCILNPDDHENTWELAGKLRKAYDDWAHENGQRITLSPKAWKATLEERGAIAERRRIGGRQQRAWVGIRLRDDITLGDGYSPPAPTDRDDPDLGL